MNLEQLFNKSFAGLRDSMVTRSCTLVTPSDTQNLPYEGFVLVLGLAGNVNVQTSTGDIVILPLLQKEIIPLRVKKIFSTSTTATNIYIIK